MKQKLYFNLNIIESITSSDLRLKFIPTRSCLDIVACVFMKNKIAIFFEQIAGFMTCDTSGLKHYNRNFV